ncbi:MAG: SBBP repeat-containing protein [candidate division Zixibacteria bacterium]|nr:SBBP repeat-containing protein [candidate division Zixibacteria bacterium]
MTRLSKFPAKIALCFCTLFSLYFPVVFSQDVDTAWVRRYNGPGNGDDRATAIAVDSGGNVYVTGSCFDSATGYDYCTIKYLPNGDTAWLRKYDGPGGFGDYAYAMEVDSSGNVYVAGESNGPGTSQDFATIKYYPNGDTAWVRRYNGPGNDNEEEPSLTIDNSGNVYITGRSADVGSVYDYATIKYDSLGNEVWVARYNGPADSDDHSNAIAVDALGNVYVTGRSLSDTTYDYATIKYAPNGDTLWVRRYDGPAGGNDVAYDLAVDLGGSVYVTGTSGYDYATLKYDSLGNPIWVRRSNSDSSLQSYEASLVAIDKTNNVYVSGTRFMPRDLIGWISIKYDSAGNQLWSSGWNGIGSGLPREPKAMTLDSMGNVFVTGYDAGYVATIKYDSEGNLLWEKLYGEDPFDFNVVGNAIAADGKGTVYVTGTAKGDFVTIKYSPLPQLKGDLNLDGVLDLNDVVFSLNCTFLGEPPPAAPAACDLNCDGTVAAADVVILLQMVFLSAPAPC